MNKIKIINQIAKPIKPLAEKIYCSLVKTPLRRFLPVGSVSIETTSICNLRCPGCYRNSHEYPSKNKNISFQDFKLYIDQLLYTNRLILHGLGEPTINPRITEMVKYAHKTKKFGRITFTTNLMAKKPYIYEELFSNGLTNLMISVDSLDQQEVEQLRPGTNVNILAKNIKVLHDRFADKISISMVINNININTFEKSIRKLAGLGIKSIRLQPFEDLGDPTNCLSQEEKKKYLKTVKNLKITGVDIKSSLGFESSKSPCYSPYISPAITVDGYLTPCCRIFNKEIFNFGNLKETHFKKLFFSKRVDKIQKEIKRGNYPLFCRNCISNHVEFNLSRSHKKR